MSYNQSTIVRGSQGNMVGRIENRTFIKAVYGSKHMLRLPMAWAIDADIFDRVIQFNCHSIQIVDLDTGAKYTTEVKIFKENCQVLDRGHGKQYFLELVHWQVGR